MVNSENPHQCHKHFRIFFKNSRFIPRFNTLIYWKFSRRYYFILKNKIAELEKILESEKNTKKEQELTPPAIEPKKSSNIIENDLKNTALTTLYRTLLGVSREPIDITKPPTNYDVLITDRTYRYENGEQKEILELTKYDSILA